MSCYICNEETWETVLKAQLMCRGCYIKDDDDLKKAWLDIVEANYQAYHDRYGDDIPKNLLELYPVPFKITDWYIPGHTYHPNKCERYEALKEYMYQCSEGGYHGRPGYYKCRWCLDKMLEDYINEEFGEE